MATTTTKKPVRVSNLKKVSNETKKVAEATTKKQKVDKKVLDTKNIKETVKQVVESEREIKYNYPAEIDNQLDRKKKKKKARNKLRLFERNIAKLEDGSKEKVKLEREYKNYRKEVLLVP